MSGPSNRTIIGVAILLFGGVLLGVGIHHMVATGSCSSTGYNQYGPVKYCPKGTAWWFAFLFGGIFLTLIGAFTSGGSTVLLLIPAIFGAVGLGSLSIVLDKHPSSGAKVFGLIFGGVFTAVAVIPAVIGATAAIGRTRSGPATGGASAFRAGGSGPPDAILGAYAAGSTGSGFGGAATSRAGTAPAGGGGLRVVQPAPRASGAAASAGDGPLEKIAKLAELRDKGALTDDEFNREKAKLLAEL